MVEFERKPKYSVQDLVRIVALLRAPGGCPWDREQTHESIRKNLIEETYEVADAIDQQDADLLCEELGDLLLQVVMHAQMEHEAGRFSWDDVCDSICQKLIYRHPHVFAAQEVSDTEQVLQNWEALKNAEKHRDTAADRLDSVPQSLPALMRSEKVQKRAAEFGFTYESVEEALQDLDSEVAELHEAVATGVDIEHELGDVLFSAANVAGKLHIDAEVALGKSCTRFASRVKEAETLAAQDDLLLKQLSYEQRDVLWKKAKHNLHNG